MEEGWVWQQHVMEVTRVCQEQRDTPLLWAVEVSKWLKGAAVSMPSVELGQMLISHLCWSNNGPMLWKYIEQAMSSHMIPSLLILALLTSRYMCFLFEFQLTKQGFHRTIVGSGCPKNLKALIVG